jgi:outer membrane protein OmpA-like peptidoglycan-associated protein
MRGILLLLAAAGLLGAVSPVMADGAKFSSDQLVNFMLKTAHDGATRGICVGTAKQCADMAKPAGFDMMVNFGLNSATLTNDAITNLQQVGKALGDPRLKGAKFEVDGYTDASGTVPFNDSLSQQRAASVAQFLMAQGVVPERLTPLGLGESSPRVPNAFDPVNRRVEIRLVLQ